MQYRLIPLALAACLAALSPASQALKAYDTAAYASRPAPFPCGDATCDAQLWLPRGVNRPPVILMAHGFGAEMDWGLEPFAERFVKAGFAVMRFDYRGFGRSGGAVRRVVDGKEHVKDWEAAIDAVRQRGDVDPQRLGLWGSSYSGGHVLVVGAERRGQVKAISSQVPFVSGWQSALRYPIKYQPLAAWNALRDLLRGPKEQPVYVPLISPDGFAALVCDECVAGYGKLVPPGREQDNKVAARVFFTLPFYAPGRSAPHVAAPTLVIAADHDGLIPIQGVRDTVKALPQGEYLELKNADHFSPYQGEVFEQVVQRQVEFFKRHL